ncbi:MAG: uracil phosphoribosyltransferase, partial [Gammaproteobacteria bacterium]|nr:uracil phosphoribosyltransferase [Gammaproteobacteria bacterium]
YRDPDTKRPVEYLRKLPSAPGRDFFLVDPMLATGYSAAAGVDVLLDHGVEPHRIHFMSLVAAPEGVQVMLEQHPDVAVYTASLDQRLNENAYIVPGLGDAGDRLYGTL